MTAPWPEPVQRVRPRKRLGQHFLVNRGVLEKLLEAADLVPSDAIIEVGPGTGFLTRELAARAGMLLAVELDRALAARLEAEFAGSDNVRIIQGDILDWPPARLLALAPGGRSAYKVVANLPYYITAPVLRHFLGGPQPPERIVAMVQYEVARSLAAAPGEMGLLAVAVQFYGHVEVVAAVSPGSFRPPPAVRSAIIRIDLHRSPPVSVPSTETFFDTVRAGFSARRKQLRNALAQGLAVPASEAVRILEHAGIDPGRRAETLSLEEWALVTKARAPQAAPAGP